MKKFIYLLIILLVGETSICAQTSSSSTRIQLYLDQAKSCISQKEYNSALNNFNAALDLLKENKGTGFIFYRSSKEIIEDILRISYSKNRISSKELADRYLSYLLDDIDYQSKRDGDDLSLSKAMRIEEISDYYSNIGDAEYSIAYEERCIQLCEDTNIWKEDYEYYEDVLEILAARYQIMNYDILSATRARYKLFNTVINRLGPESELAKHLFQGINSTVHRGYQLTLLKNHHSESSEDLIYLKNIETSLACLYEWRSICIEISKKYGSPYLDELLTYTIQDYRDYLEQSGLSLDLTEYDVISFIGQTYLDEPYIYLYYGDNNGAFESSKSTVGYFLSYETSHKYYACSELGTLFEDYNLPAISYDIYDFAINQATSEENYLVAETMRVKTARSLYRSGDLMGARLFASMVADDDLLFWFDSINNFVEANSILSAVSRAIFDYENAILYGERVLDVIEGHIPSVKDTATYKLCLSKSKDKVEDIPADLVSTYRANLAGQYASVGDYEKAFAVLEKDIEYRKNQNLDLDYSILRQLGALKYKTGDRKGAISLIRKSYEHFAEMNFYSENELSYLPVLYMEEGNRDSTEFFTRLYSKYIIDDFVSRSSGMPEIDRYNLWDVSYHTDYLGIIGYTLSPFGEELSDLYYDSALLFKGFLLNNSKTIAQNILESGDEELITAYDSFKRAKASGSKDAKLLENQCMFLYSLHPELYKQYHQPKWEEVRNSLGSNDIAIEFVHCFGNVAQEPIYKALVLTSKSNKPQIITLCSESELERLAEQFQRKATDGMLMSLYDLVWSKIEPYINKNANVYFSPHEILNQLNLEFAMDPKGRLISDKYNLHRVSTTASISRDGDVTFNRSSLFGGLVYDSSYSQTLEDMGIDARDLTRTGYKFLEASLEEVETIYSMIDKKQISVALYTGDAGTESSFKNLSAKNIPIIHVATHGFYYNSSHDMERNDKDMYEYLNHGLDTLFESRGSIPLMKRSGLLFSGATSTLDKGIAINSEDNILFSEEISGLDLSETKLLVLSACQTGLGQINGDGVYGLQRAFKLAGVETIIMSLWYVNDDATKLMMVSLYEKLLEGKSKHAAFNYAINVVKKEFKDPTYWAAFIMLD